MNRFLMSDVFYLFIALLCAAAFVTSLELAFYTISVALLVWIVLFCERMDRFLVLVPFYYIAPSTIQNPARHETSIFLNAGCMIYLGVLAAIAIGFATAAAIRCERRRRGIRCTRKPPVLWLGLLLLGVAYALSGIFTSGSSLKNLAYAMVQIFFLTLLYWIAYYVIDEETYDTAMFAKLGVAMGLTLMLEVVDIYIAQGVLSGGYLHRSQIQLGWGVYNNLGNMLCVALPGAFYMMYRARHRIPWLLYACLLMVAIGATTSRGSIVTGMVIFLLSLMVALIKLRQRKLTLTILGLFCGVTMVIFVTITILYFCNETIHLTVEKVLGVGFWNDFGRFQTWESGWRQFRSAPLFGRGFYECDAYLYENGYAGMIPARWHNLFVQLLASCGILGLLAYLFHRFQHLRMVFRTRTAEGYLLALSLLAIVLGSMIDNHFFNIGPGILWGMLLAFSNIASNQCGEIRTCGATTSSPQTR